MYDTSWLAGPTNVMADVVVDRPAFVPVVKVYDVRPYGMRMIADVVKQQLVYLRLERFV